MKIRVWALMLVALLLPLLILLPGAVWMEMHWGRIFTELDEVLDQAVRGQVVSGQFNPALERGQLACVFMLRLMALAVIAVFAVAGTLATMVLYRLIGAEPHALEKILQNMALGRLKNDLPDNASGLARATRGLSQVMQRIITQLQVIAAGDLSQDMPMRNAGDNFSTELQHMQISLRKNRTLLERAAWVKEGLSSLTVELVGDLNLNDMATKAVTFICRYADLHYGLLYIHYEDRRQLNLGGSFAHAADSSRQVFEYNQGLVGQVAAEKQPILLKIEDPDKPVVEAGGATWQCKAHYVMPLLFEFKLLGVMELAALEAFRPDQLDFFHEAGVVIAARLDAAIRGQAIKDLLEGTRMAQQRTEAKARQLQEANLKLEEQQQQLQQQTEELRQANLQLEEQQQQIQQQNEEQQQTNQMLEEQQQQLQQQNEETKQQNEELVHMTAELKNQTLELQRTNRYKAEFLANMSHELRTPLNSIQMLSKMLQRNTSGRLSKDEIKKASVIHSAGAELLRLINDILDLSKIEAGKVDLNIAPFATSGLADELVNYFEPLTSEKGLDYSVEDRIGAELTGDREKIGQILRNFISNAIKFTEKGSVSVIFELVPEDEDRIVFQVRDTGVGIPKEHFGSIFNEFEQVDSSSSRKFGGTGLGLTIARQLAEMMQGKVTLSSVIDQGSVFSLILPRRLLAEDVRSRQPREPESPSFAGPVQVQVMPKVTYVKDDRATISPTDILFMVVEDDAAFAESVGNIVHMRGFKFIHAPTAADGEMMAGMFPLRGIFLDIQLPDFNGIELLRRLRRNPSTRNVPVQILSACDPDPTVLELGGVEFKQKPLPPEDIVSSLARMSGQSPKKQQVLIVEDDQTLAEAMGELVRSLALQASAVQSRSEAYEALRKDCDIVIVDLGLEDGSGLDICRHIRENGMNLPVIIYTGKEVTPEEEKNLKAYAECIILKTANSEERLLDEIRALLSVSQPVKSPLVRALNLEQKLIGKKILVVDDDIKNVYVTGAALEEQGARVVDAQHGRQALEILRQERFDLVLVDIMMPEMDGYEMLRTVRGWASSDDMHCRTMAQAPMIALTAKAIKGDREACLRAGANDYLAKPVDYDALITLIHAWITRMETS